MKANTRTTLKVAILAAAISTAGFAVAGTPQTSTGSPSALLLPLLNAKTALKDFFASAKTPTADSQDKAEGVNPDMIYMPGKGNGVCNENQGKRDSCMADVVVTFADGVKRTGFGVFVGHNLIATNYELTTSHGDHAAKPGDGHSYTIALSDGTTRMAVAWAIVPGSVTVLRMQ